MYFIIPNFAMARLKLSGNNLLVFSLIMSFGTYYGSLQFMAERLNITKRTVINCLNYLCDNDLIKRKINGYNEVIYIPCYNNDGEKITTFINK